jgi:hypothetical protein
VFDPLLLSVKVIEDIHAYAESLFAIQAITRIRQIYYVRQ